MFKLGILVCDRWFVGCANPSFHLQCRLIGTRLARKGEVFLAIMAVATIRIGSGVVVAGIVGHAGADLAELLEVFSRLGRYRISTELLSRYVTMVLRRPKRNIDLQYIRNRACRCRGFS